MIYVAKLTDENGLSRNHNGRPSKKFLLKNPQFKTYFESGKFNEYIYRSTYQIYNGVLKQVSDYEFHEREM